MSLSRFVQAPISVGLARILPICCVRFCTQFLGLVYFFRQPKHAHDIIKDISHCVGKSCGEPVSRKLLVKVFFGILEHYFEKMLMAYKPIEQTQERLRSRFCIPDESWLNAVVSTQKGGLMLSGHIGAVEFLPLALAMRGYRNAIILRYSTPDLKSALQCLERTIYPLVALIDVREGQVRRRAVRALAEGRILITLCDEFKEWRCRPGHFLTAFGKQVLRDKSLDLFYYHAGVPVSLGVVLRKNGKFALEVIPIADGKEKISLSERAWTELEKYILRYPEQWYQWGKVEELLSPA